MEDYDSFEKRYLKYYYPDYKVVRTVVLYGSREERIIEAQIGFLLNKDGKLVLGIQAPLLFRRAIAHLLDYWKNGYPIAKWNARLFLKEVIL